MNYEHHIGKKITTAILSEDTLIISFQDGTAIALRDDGQDCCEERYMTTDDDIASLVGHNLLKIEEKKIEESPIHEPHQGYVHEICFIEVATDNGFVTINTHNQHNGYYGGFILLIEDIKHRVHDS